MMSERVRTIENNSPNDAMLLCCMCGNLVNNSQQLRCLHNCCRSCIEASTAARGTADEPHSAAAALTPAEKTVACPICEELSEVKFNGFVDGLARRWKATAGISVCSVCTSRGDSQQLANTWCSLCSVSLCETCSTWHASFHKTHTTIAIDEVTDWDAVLNDAPASLCAIHLKPFDGACFSCSACKCTECWSVCAQQQQQHHDVKHLSDPAVTSYTTKARDKVRSLEQSLRNKAEQVLHTRKRLEADLRKALDDHLRLLKTRKMRLLKAVDDAYTSAEQRLRDTYDDLREKAVAIWKDCEVLEHRVTQAVDYSRFVADASRAPDLLNQESTLVVRIQSLSSELEQLRQPLAAGDCLAFDSVMPDDDSVLAEQVALWIGTPTTKTDDLYTRIEVTGASVASDTGAAAPQHHRRQPLVFGAASSAVRLPFECRDVSVTESGSLLLASYHDGLLEFGWTGGELSRWRPPKRRGGSNSEGGEDDEVWAVEALSDGRAAAGLYWQQLVVLLRRVGGTAVAASAADDAWAVDVQLDRLQESPWSLSVHGDVLAVAEWSGRLELMSLSSGHRLCEAHREYGIWRVAVTAELVVTVSGGGEAKLDGYSSRSGCGSGSKMANVVDAHSRESNLLLWRYELGDGEEAKDVCSDATGRVLYVAVWRSDRSRGWLMAIGAADGVELRRDAHNFDGPLLPFRQRLCKPSERRGIVVVMLCYDTTTKEKRAVLVYPSVSSRRSDSQESDT